MKTISIAEFEALVARNDWVRTQEHEFVERDYRYDELYDNETGEAERTEIDTEWGWLAITSTLNGLSITHHRTYNCDQHEPDSLTTDENPDVAWEISGFKVVDDDGETLNAHELADYLPSDGRFEDFDSEKIVTKQVTDIDVDEDSDMEAITLIIDNNPNIRFTGECVAGASSRNPYNNGDGRWTEIELYKTKGGKYICHSVGVTCWQGEHDRYSGKVCETLDEVKEFFGYGWLAKELYDKAGIDCIVEVD